MKLSDVVQRIFVRKDVFDYKEEELNDRIILYIIKKLESYNFSVDKIPDYYFKYENFSEFILNYANQNNVSLPLNQLLEINEHSSLKNNVLKYIHKHMDQYSSHNIMSIIYETDINIDNVREILLFEKDGKPLNAYPILRYLLEGAYYDVDKSVSFIKVFSQLLWEDVELVLKMMKKDDYCITLFEHIIITLFSNGTLDLNLLKAINVDLMELVGDRVYFEMVDKNPEFIKCVPLNKLQSIVKVYKDADFGYDRVFGDTNYQKIIDVLYPYLYSELSSTDNEDKSLKIKSIISFFMTDERGSNLDFCKRTANYLMTNFPDINLFECINVSLNSETISFICQKTIDGGYSLDEAKIDSNKALADMLECYLRTEIENNNIDKVMDIIKKNSFLIKFVPVYNEKTVYGGITELLTNICIEAGFIPKIEDFNKYPYLFENKMLVNKMLEIDKSFFDIFVSTNAEGNYSNVELDRLGKLFLDSYSKDIELWSEEKRQKFMNLKVYIGDYSCAKVFKDILLNDKFDKFILSTNDNQIFLILKYVYYSDYRDAFLTIVNENEYDNFFRIYSIVNNSQDFNIGTYCKILEKYSSCKSLCYSFLSGNYSDYDVRLLTEFIFSNDENYKEVTSMEDLKKSRDGIYERDLKIISGIHTNDVDSKIKLLNIIFMRLCNKKKYDKYRDLGNFYMNNLDIETMLEKVINSEKIDLLLKEIKDRETIEELKNIKVIIELIEKIVTLDVEELKKIAINICELWKNDNENFNTSYQYFFNIENIVKRIYGVEVSEKSTKISDLNSDTKGVIFEKGKYKPTILEYKGEKVSQDGVDYIQLDGMPFTFFTHVLNGFGYGGDITYFKEQKLIGKSHICLSAINDKHVNFFNQSKKGNNDISGVTLIFSNLPPEKLVGMNHEDMGTQEDNYRRIYSPNSHVSFEPLKDIMHNTATGKYNEYVYNRDGLYPSGVLISGDEPTDAEINAAAYLKIPLVKINVEKYKYGYDSFVENKEVEANKKKLEEYRQLRKLIEETSGAILEEGGRTR